MGVLPIVHIKATRSQINKTVWRWDCNQQLNRAFFGKLSTDASTSSIAISGTFSTSLAGHAKTAGAKQVAVVRVVSVRHHHATGAAFGDACGLAQNPFVQQVEIGRGFTAAKTE